MKPDGGSKKLVDSSRTGPTNWSASVQWDSPVDQPVDDSRSHPRNALPNFRDGRQSDPDWSPSATPPRLTFRTQIRRRDWWPSLFTAFPLPIDFTSNVISMARKKVNRCQTSTGDLLEIKDGSVGKMIQNINGNVIRVYFGFYLVLFQQSNNESAYNWVRTRNRKKKRYASEPPMGSLTFCFQLFLLRRRKAVAVVILLLFCFVSPFLSIFFLNFSPTYFASSGHGGADQEFSDYHYVDTCLACTEPVGLLFFGASTDSFFFFFGVCVCSLILGFFLQFFSLFLNIFFHLSTLVSPRTKSIFFNVPFQRMLRSNYGFLWIFFH